LSTISSYAPVRAGNWLVQRVHLHRFWHRKVSMSPCACPVAKCVWFSKPAAQPSVRSAMQNTPMSSWVKQVVVAGLVGDPLFVVPRWILLAIHMVVVNVNPALVWRPPKHRG